MDVVALVLIVLTAFGASLLGPICGIGGGVIIKPVLDALGLLDVSTVSLLSGLTVFTMSLATLIQNIRARSLKVDLGELTPLAVGSALGGIIGKQLFSWLLALTQAQALLGFIQSVLLVILLIIAFVYTLKKNSVKAMKLKSSTSRALVGFIAGALWAFLGIGGGPFNFVMFSFFFAYASKLAAQSSIFVIACAQGTALLWTLGKSLIQLINTSSTSAMVSGNTAALGASASAHPEPSVFILVLLMVLMAASAVLGAFVGKKIVAKISSQMVDRLYLAAVVAIELLCFRNLVVFAQSAFGLRLDGSFPLYFCLAQLIILGFFIYSVWVEPRRFRNALLLVLIGVLGLAGALSGIGAVSSTFIICFIFGFILLYLVGLVVLLANGFVILMKMGPCLTAFLPWGLALLMLAAVFSLPLTVTYFSSFSSAAHVSEIQPVLLFVMGLLQLESIWFCTQIFAYLLYSTFYRLLPRRRKFDFILVHGAGLSGTRPGTILTRRLEKALDLWARQTKPCRFVLSGGKGSDEQISEAEAMYRYLKGRGVSPQQMILEDESTTTWENIEFSKKIMDELMAGSSYRAALVTSDYHCFRAAEYASRLKLKADSVGATTGLWYWPAAAIREFLSLTRLYKWGYVVIAAFWMLAFFILIFLN